MASAAMQSVSDAVMVIELAKQGGLSFIYCSQPIESQCQMVNHVKSYKAGFVESDSNLGPKGEGDFKINNGHSKDYRPDLKQFKVGAAVQQDGLPMM